MFRNRRDLITRRINEIPRHVPARVLRGVLRLPLLRPGLSSAELADRLTRNGLICASGSAFGKYGEAHLRFSYAIDEAKIDAGMDILSKVIAEAR